MSNTGWLFADKFVRLGIGMLVSIWVARYLGPDQFGLLNYVLAYTALFGALAALGLNTVVVRDLVKLPDCAAKTLGTTVFLQFAGGILAYALAVLAIVLSRPGDELARDVVVVLGLVLIFKSTDVVKFWFESQVQSRYVVWVESSVLLTLAVIQVILILLQAPLMAFVWAAFVNALLVSAGLIWVYSWQVRALKTWCFDRQRAVSLLKDSWPLLLSGLAIMIYMRLDQIMLGVMLGDGAVGIYTAAVRISEAWYFVPIAVVSSVFPSIIKAKQQNEALYSLRLRNLYSLMFVLSLSVAVPMTFLSEQIIVLLFGQSYAEAGLILSIHIWSGVFVALGVARGKWLLIEELQRYSFWYVGTGAIVNVLGNFLLIPYLGMVGAATSTLISQVVSVIVAPYLIKETRASVLQILRSLNFTGLFIKSDR